MKEGDKVSFVFQFDDRKQKYRAVEVTSGGEAELLALPVRGVVES